MMRALLFLIAVLAAPSVVLAGECRDARDAYRSAQSDLTDAIHNYGRCVSQSDGHDDCSVEFSTLQSAQNDFETAVSDYDEKCR
jgi:hypothetical protein